MTDSKSISRAAPPGCIHRFPKRGAFLVINILFILCLLLLIIVDQTSPKNIGSKANVKTTPHVAESNNLPTKWWIKTPAYATPHQPQIDSSASSTTTLNNICPPDLSQSIQPGAYAYISPDPPVPNRIRSGAGKTYPFIGQIEPGAGIRIIAGSLCADGYSWWLVEINNDHRRGWTAAGSRAQPWIIPCVDPYLPCNMVPASSITATLTAEDSGKDTCRSELLAKGSIAQVGKGNLLVIRSEPYIGAVIGYAGPLSSVEILDGPRCAGGAVWWKVKIPRQNWNGWAAEANLTVCSKEDDCM